jgi:hypothetical protein
MVLITSYLLNMSFVFLHHMFLYSQKSIYEVITSYAFRLLVREGHDDGAAVALGFLAGCPADINIWNSP